MEESYNLAEGTLFCISIICKHNNTSWLYITKSFINRTLGIGFNPSYNKFLVDQIRQSSTVFNRSCNKKHKFITLFFVV